MKAFVAWSMLLIACSGGASDEIVVSAASSLTGAFTEIEAAFEAEHPGTNVILNLGGSSALREQIIEGAPVDVFASANTVTMDQVASAVDDPVIFVTNQLEMAVPPGNPGSVTSLEDFARDELLIGLCAPAVPCGALSLVALREAGVDPSIDSSEPNVRLVLAKVEAGELDAGIVYSTDVMTGDVEGLPLGIFTDYAIATLLDAPNAQGASDFVAFVLSEEGQAILRSHGFGSI